MRVAIISGGRHKSDISTNSATHIYNNIRGSCAIIHMIRVSPDGTWKENGLVTDMHRILPTVDHVVDLRKDVRNADESKLISSLRLIDHFKDCETHDHFKKLCFQLSVDHPRYFIIRKEEANVEHIIHDMWRRVHLPIRVTPNTGIGAILTSYEYHEVVKHIKYLHSKNEDVVVEEVKDTVRFKIVSIRNLRKKNIYLTLPHVVNNKNSTNLNEIIADENINELLYILNRMYKVIDHKLLLVEFIINRDKVMILGYETKPDLSEHSIAFKLMNDLGITFDEIFKAAP